MKILITGHKGFIGQNLMQYLTQQGYTVEGYEYDSKTFPDTIRFDQVIHLGAISSTTETNIEKIMLQNYDFSMKLLKKCISARVPLQYASSASVYGNTKDFSESSNKNPNSAYSWSKYLFDREVDTIIKDNFVVIDGAVLTIGYDFKILSTSILSDIFKIFNCPEILIA